MCPRIVSRRTAKQTPNLAGFGKRRAKIVPIADPAQVCLVIASRQCACETGKRRQRMPWPVGSSASAIKVRPRSELFQLRFARKEPTHELDQNTPPVAAADRFRSRPVRLLFP